MKNSVAFLVAAAVFAAPVALFADDCGACPATKAAKSTTSTTCTSGQTCSAKGNYVMLKIKGADQAAISKALAKLDGVTAETCNESKFTKISYAKDKACSDSIMTALKQGGQKVEAQRVAFAVDGLSCGACGDKVSKALSKVKGVSNAKVCMEGKMATVDFDPNKVSSSKVMAAIDAAGFKATESLN